VSKLNHYFLTAFLIFSFRIFSQELLFEKPYNLTNLPSNECYNVIQDKKGYIWFSTDAGLCKYDGNGLKVFSKKEGLPEESCYGIAADTKGSIYVITSSNRILKSIDDSLYELKFTKDLAEVLNTNSSIATDFKFIKDSIIIINTQVCTYQVNLITNKFEKLVTSNKQTHHRIEIIDDNIYPSKYEYNTKIFRKEMPKEVEIEVNFISLRKQTIIHLLNSLNKKGFLFRVQTAIDKHNKLYIGFGNVLISYNSATNKASFSTFNDEILSLLVDKSDGIWIGFKKSGLLYSKSKYENDLTQYFALSNVSVSGIFEDSDGNIWCSTLEDGIYLCKNKKIILFKSQNELKAKFTLFKPINDTFFYSSYYNQIGVFTKNFHSTLNLNKKDNPTINDIIKAKNGYILANNSSIFECKNNFTEHKSIKLLDTPYAYWGNQVVRHKHQLFGINKTTLFEIVGYRIFERILKFKSKLVSIYSTEEGLFVVGTNEIYKIDPHTFEHKQILKLNGIKIAKTNRLGKLFLSTKISELYEKVNGKLIQIDLSSLSNLKIHDFTFDDKENILLATNQGIVEIDASSHSIVKVYTEYEGLPLETSQKIETTGNTLFLGTEKGLYVLQNGWKYSSINHGLKIKSVFANSKPIPLSKSIELDYNQNNIRIKIENLDYKNNPRTYKLEYRINNEKNNTYVNQENEILFTDIAPGAYEISLWNNDTKFPNISLVLIINKPFWQKLWFYLLIITIVIVVIYFGVKLYLKKLRAKDAKESEITNLINNYQMAAIRAQMNPHFIFNCINSIQRYVLTNDRTTAYNYLTKFSKLIRLVLNNSEEENISLKDELEMVSLYIQLEQLRFEDSFIFELIVSNDLDTDSYLIPPMMLQPYIENSIWHGIMLLNNSRKGKISIFVSENNDMLVIEIIDNGVGREEAMKHSSKTHKSKANKLNERRIDIINAINHSINGSIKITDVLNDKDQSVSGTKVTLLIPQSYE